MTEEAYIGLIYKQLKGTITISDQVLLDQWISTNDTNKSIYDQIVDIWKASENYAPPMVNIDMDQEWNKLAQRTGIEAKVIPLYRKWTSIAAVFALLIGSIFVIKNVTTTSDTLQIIAEIDNHKHRMPDGTSITMQKGAQLSWSKDYSSKRLVNLQGQALFEVTHDSLSHFVVQTPDVEVTVLGTTFFINDATDDGSAEVQLIEGSVKVKFIDAEEKRIMTPGDKLMVDEGTIIQTSLKISDYQWYSYDIEFASTPLQQVWPVLSNYFGVEIIDNSKVSECLLSGKFTGMTLDNILDKLREIYNIQIRPEADHIVIINGEC